VDARPADVLSESESSKSSKEEIEPRGHGSGVVGNTPGDRYQSYSGGRPGCEEFSGEGIDCGNPDEEAGKEKKSKPEKVDAEEFKDSSVDISQAASVGVFEITMRYFAMQNALRTLAERALVMRNPTFVEVGAQVDSGEQPHEEENQHAPAG